jgi:Flp pilus assembly protein TadG
MPSALRTPLRSCAAARRLCARFLPHETGIAAVEFALILPILLVLWIGGVEVTSGLSVDRRMNNFASSLGDLVSRSKTLVYADIEDIFNLAPQAMFPYGTTAMTMRVTAVKMDSSRNAKVVWSRSRSMTAYTADTQLNTVVPDTLREPGSEIILSEVFYTYRPAVGYVITGALNLQSRMFFVPRLVAAVQLCDNAGQNCKI